jgi:hypothetical protein
VDHREPQKAAEQESKTAKVFLKEYNGTTIGDDLELIDPPNTPQARGSESQTGIKT